MVANTFGSNNEAVANDLDFTPDDGVVVGWKTTEVLQFTLLRNLRERGTVGLTDGNLGKSQCFCSKSLPRLGGTR
jgi:hypothetical protein